jgi:hypothetical protein
LTQVGIFCAFESHYEHMQHLQGGGSMDLYTLATHTLQVCVQVSLFA